MECDIAPRWRTITVGVALQQASVAPFRLSPKDAEDFLRKTQQHVTDTRIDFDLSWKFLILAYGLAGNKKHLFKEIEKQFGIGKGCPHGRVANLIKRLKKEFGNFVFFVVQLKLHF